MKLNPVQADEPVYLPVNYNARPHCEPLSGEQLLQVVRMPDNTVMLLFRVLQQVYGKHMVRTVILEPNVNFEDDIDEPDLVLKSEVLV
jgi:hypothetical protein